MPELPEVETIARQLQQVLPGKVIKEIEVKNEKSLQGQSLKLIGRRINMVNRKQKMVVIELQAASPKLQEELVLLIHLKMTGQLIYIEKDKRLVGGHPTEDWVGELPSKHTRVIVKFTDGSVLYFNDQRKFGWMKVMVRSSWLVAHRELPPDVVDETFTVEYLMKVFKNSKRAVKLVILDQDKMGGMGNIYANDALYLAKVNPFIPANQVKMDAVKSLYEAMRTVINKGIELGGASERNYVHIDGFGGHYQDYFLAYGQEGKQCRACGSMMEKRKVGGRGTVYCPKCQQN